MNRADVVDLVVDLVDVDLDFDLVDVDLEVDLVDVDLVDVVSLFSGCIFYFLPPGCIFSFLPRLFQQHGCPAVFGASVYYSEVL